jgi:hypothetical protein
MGATNVFTKIVTDDTFTISASGNAVRVSVLCKLGTISVQGSSTFDEMASEAINLSEGQGLTIVAPVVTSPVDGFVITAGTAGDIAEVIIMQS